MPRGVKNFISYRPFPGDKHCPKLMYALSNVKGCIVLLTLWKRFFSLEYSCLEILQGMYEVCFYSSYNFRTYSAGKIVNSTLFTYRYAQYFCKPNRLQQNPFYLHVQGYAVYTVHIQFVINKINKCVIIM